MTTTRWSRRQFLGTFAAAVGGLAAGPALLAACGGNSAPSVPTGSGGKGGKQLTVSTWPIYIDSEPVGETTLDLFEKATGITVTWNEDINDNNEFFAKIQPLLSKGKTIEADVITPTYWLIPRLKGLGWLEKLPAGAVSNATNLVPSLKNPGWDPSGQYSLPWQSGITGIAYNRKAAGRELRSVADLFDPAFKGKIGMLTEMRDTMGLVLLSEGKDPSSATFEDAESSFAKLEKAKADGQIRKFTGNDYQDELTQGAFVACVGWSGDIAQLALDNPDLQFVIPEEGGMRWADCMALPKGATNTAAAATFMDFVYNPVNAARITAAVQYVTPVAGVQDELRKIGGNAAKLADSPLLFPDDATSKRLKVFANLSEEEEASFDEAFSKLTGA